MLMDLVQATAQMGYGHIVQPILDHEDDTDYNREPDALATWMETELG